MTRPLFLLALSCALVAGCADNHQIDVDTGASPVDSGTRSIFDVGPSRVNDTGSTAPVDGSRIEPDMGPPVTMFMDAGVHPLPDGGPPGDGAGDTWTGYIESYMFDSGSDVIRIVFDSSGTTGHVYFGNGTPPPPATDPNVGYPPGFGDGRFFDEPGSYLAEGFAYPFEGAVVSMSRVQLTVQLGALWSDWCGLQYPVALDASDEAYGCLPNTGYTSSDTNCSYGDPPMPIDCGRLMLCSMETVCMCDASSCTSNDVHPIALDFHVTGDDATGSLDIAGLHNMYLTR